MTLRQFLGYTIEPMVTTGLAMFFTYAVLCIFCGVPFGFAEMFLFMGIGGLYQILKFSLSKLNAMVFDIKPSVIA